MDRIDELLLRERGARPRRRHGLQVGFARTAQVRRAAQALRWRVFAEELGARLPSREPGIDEDVFDTHCEHLVVREEESWRGRRHLPSAGTGGGATRRQLLLGDRIRPDAAAPCPQPHGRSGAFLHPSGAPQRRGHHAALGRAHSLHADARLRLSRRLRVHGHGRRRPRRGLRVSRDARAAFGAGRIPRVPALRAAAGGARRRRRRRAPAAIRGYLRAGAWVCGEPAWDPDFNTADFFLLLPLANVAPRYARHFLGQTHFSQAERRRPGLSPLTHLTWRRQREQQLLLRRARQGAARILARCNGPRHLMSQAWRLSSR